MNKSGFSLLEVLIASSIMIMISFAVNKMIALQGQSLHDMYRHTEMENLYQDIKTKIASKEACTATVKNRNIYRYDSHNKKLILEFRSHEEFKWNNKKYKIIIYPDRKNPDHYMINITSIEKLHLKQHNMTKAFVLLSYKNNNCFTQKEASLEEFCRSTGGHFNESSSTCDLSELIKKKALAITCKSLRRPVSKFHPEECMKKTEEYCKAYGGTYIPNKRNCRFKQGGCPMGWSASGSQRGYAEKKCCDYAQSNHSATCNCHTLSAKSYGYHSNNCRTIKEYAGFCGAGMTITYNHDCCQSVNEIACTY